MSYIHFAEESDQEKRIAKLRQEVEKLGGNTMSLESMPADMEEEFLRHVLEYESADPISLLQLLERLQEVIGTDIAPQFAEARSGDIQHSSADVTKARELLKFEPIISLQDGLANAVAWYRTQPV